jgi:hypothetical protein
MERLSDSDTLAVAADQAIAGPMLGTQVESAPAQSVADEAAGGRTHVIAARVKPMPAVWSGRFGPVSLVTSVLVHGAIVLGALIQWGSPMPLAATPPSVTVDIVSAKDVPQLQVPELPPVQPVPREAPKPERSTQEAAGQQPPKQNPPPAKQPQAQQEPAKQDRPNPAAAQRERTPAPEAGVGPGWMEGAVQAHPMTPSVDLGTSPSEIRAKLAPDTVAGFKAHMDKCFVPVNAGADAARLKLVVRIALRPDGQLAAAPQVLKADGAAAESASVFLKSVKHALQQCQPYNFLPANKYKEWRILDLSFTPDGLLGG